VTGVLAATPIGLGGAIGGGLRLGPTYGLAMFVVFSIVVGAPAGLVGGLIKWAGEPFATPRPSHAGPSLRRDRILAVGCAAVLMATSTTGLLILLGPFEHAVRPIMERLPGFSVRPECGLLIGAVLGAIVGCTQTGWPTFAIAHGWLTLRGKLPWRWTTFLENLHAAGILRREGDIHQFRYAGLREHLADSQDGRELPPTATTATGVATGRDGSLTGPSDARR
jgi:hypothetical protein